MRWLLCILLARAILSADTTEPSPSHDPSGEGRRHHWRSHIKREETEPFSPSTPILPTPTAWLTGPLLAPTGTATPYGDFEIEVYGYFTTNTGTYNEHWESIPATHNFFSFNNQYSFFFGLTPWMDINILSQYSINSTRGKTSSRFGDLTVILDIQAYPATTPYWFPGIKLAVEEIFPTGSFQHSNPANFGTDQTGAGTFATAFNLVLYKVYHFTGHYFMSMTLSGYYQINTPVHVHGYNTYGGGIGTNGRILPGNIFEVIASFEFTLSQNWVFAIDNVYSHINASSFYGNPGMNDDGSLASVGGPSSEQFTFAPAIEYNFSSDIGIIAGCWFSATGRNSTQFTSGVVEFIYTY